MTITLRNLHRKVRVKVPHVLEALVTATLQDAAVEVCRETHASQQMITVTVDETTVFPLALTPVGDVEICGFVNAVIKLTGSASDPAEIPPTDWPDEPASATKGSPSGVAWRVGEVVLVPEPSESYDLTICVATAPLGDFDTVGLPTYAESAIVDLTLAELYMQPDDKGRIRAELAQLRHRSAVNRINDILFRSAITSTGEARIGVDPGTNYFSRR